MRSQLMRYMGRPLYGILQLIWQILRPIQMAVRILLVKDNCAIFVSHNYIPRWYLPGGLVKRGESMTDAARREAYEEVGARLLGEPQLFQIYPHFGQGRSCHTAYFYCHDFVLDDQIDALEIAHVKTFDLDNLPPDVAHGTQEVLRDYRKVLSIHNG